MMPFVLSFWLITAGVNGGGEMDDAYVFARTCAAAEHAAREIARNAGAELRIGECRAATR